MTLFVFAALQAAAGAPAGAFRSPRVVESSGVVVSRQHPGTLWTHNDSGDGPYLYATDTLGRDLGAMLVSGADAEDWEDLGLGPCPKRDGTCLFIGDVGDNFEGRERVTVYAVPEPPPPQGPGDTLGVTGAADALRLRYPDGAHDVEALYVAPGDGTLFLVSKGRSPPVRLYRVDRRAWDADTVVTAELVQAVPLHAAPRARLWITGAAIRADGRMAALRSLHSVYLFSVGPAGRLTPAGVCRLRIAEYQGEAVDFLDDSTLVLTSEARSMEHPGEINVARCAPQDGKGRLSP